MKFLPLLAILLVSTSLHAQTTSTPPGETVTRIARSAGDQLAESISTLNALREQIEAEKLPLARELTTLEEKLTTLRREHGAATRLVDAGALEMATLRAEVKGRQDELAYITTLLDEYARTFDSKVNVCELQQYGEAAEVAKQAGENTTLAMTDRFARQTSFVELSMKRLFNVVGGTRFPGIGVDLEGVVTEGQFVIFGPVALFAAGSNGIAGLVVPQSGSSLPLIRPLEGALQAGLVSFVSTGDGFLPLDPSRGGALKALVQRTNLVHIFEKGGPIMWPLLITSIIALAVVLERLLFLFIVRLRRDPRAQDRFFQAVARGDLNEAVRIGKSSKFYVVRALGYALDHRDTSLASAILLSQARELKRFQRGVPILDTAITLAPLLGLLGTVTGMMGSFSIIGGELSSPGAITGGIAEALIATAFGLGIAITALLPFNFLNARIEQARHEIESTGTQLELLVNPQAATAAAEPSSPHAPSSTIDPARVEPHVPARPAADHLRMQSAIRRQIAELQAALDAGSMNTTDARTAGDLAHRD